MSVTSGDTRGCRCFDWAMYLPHADATEIAAWLPLPLELEPYRERLTPLAMAVLQGEPRRVIDRRRDLVLADVWDGPLKEAAARGLATLRKELERKLAMLTLAGDELAKPPHASKLVPGIVDRVLAELLDANDANLDALEELERELAELPECERSTRAAHAARGAFVAARIPPNEFRAAMVRGARAASRGDADEAARAVARALGTRARRLAARDWVRTFADASAGRVPILAGELAALSSGPPPEDPGDDLIWIQACVGLTFDFGLARS